MTYDSSISPKCLISQIPTESEKDSDSIGIKGEEVGIVGCVCGWVGVNRQTTNLRLLNTCKLWIRDIIVKHAFLKLIKARIKGEGEGRDLMKS